MYWDLFYGLLVNVPYALEKNVYPGVTECSILLKLADCVDKDLRSLLIFYWLFLWSTEREVLKSPAIIMDLNTYSLNLSVFI